MPAGDLEKAKIAYQYGADACYGSTSAFSMRTREIGFNYKTLKEAIEYAHFIGKKFYVTLNTYPHECEMAKIRAHARKLIAMQPDAIIVADPGILQIVKNQLTSLKKLDTNKFQILKHKTQNNIGTVKQYSNRIELHLSTQANATNSEAIKFWAKNGVSRIILPRELSITEIIEIRKKVPKKIMLEAFVHGAMCNSVSGRCNLSNYLSYRDANRGTCVQACRWKYTLVEEKRPGQFMPVEEDDHGSYIYNSKDLNMIDHLKELHDAGIKSFKVEGRNKSIYYCAIVARAYRKAIDNLAQSKNQGIKELKRELDTVTNREYSTGFYFGKPTDADINYQTSRPSSDWQFVGIVKKKLDTKFHPEFISGSHKIPKRVQNGNCYLIEARNEIIKNSWVEIVTPDKIYRKKLTKFTTLQGDVLEKLNPNNHFILQSPAQLCKNAVIRMKKTN